MTEEFGDIFPDPATEALPIEPAPAPEPAPCETGGDYGEVFP